MATDFKGGLGVGGAAMRRMQELAQSLYDSTPGLQEEIPRHQSKILANVKREDNRAENRAKTFLMDNGVGLRKGGTIEKKDLTIAMSAEDWETKYFQILEKFNHEKHETVRLRQNMIKKQERYIDREHEYRRTIAQIEQSIQEKSTKPLEIIHEHDENQLLLSGVDPTEGKQQELMEKERKQKIKNELQINQKHVKAIHSVYDKIMETIGLIQDKTAKELESQRDEIWKTLDKKLEDIKQQLRAETEKKRENQYDFKEKERELNEHLETMTQIAQKIDDENRNLMKKNSELKIQYMSQENDRDLLLKQLIYQKKEHQRLRKMLEQNKKEADEMVKTQEQENTMINNENLGGLDNSKSFTNNFGPSGQTNTIPIINQRNQSGIKNTKTVGMGGRQNQNMNISALNNNSRRNISLTGGAVFNTQSTAANMIGGNRPKTAAMPGLTGMPRPPTAAYNFGKRQGTKMASNAAYGFNFIGQQRAISANILTGVNNNLLYSNPKIKRYEDIISRLKKMLNMEKKSLRMVRTLCSKEIEIKNQLEKILRQCVDDVKTEIAKKRSENKSIYHKVTRKIDQTTNQPLDEKALTQQEREKIIEVLLSQERVLTLLYDKTFPPRPATAKVSLKNAFSQGGLNQSNNLRQFNYYGQINEDIEFTQGLGDGLGAEDGEDAQEVQKLEREIEEVLRNRISTAEGLQRGRYNDQGANSIINISKGGADNSLKMSAGVNGQRQQSAATVGGGQKRNLMSAAYRHRQNLAQAADETNEFADDIYEDEESSDEMD